MIFAGDRLTVVARRRGLDWLTRQCAPPAHPVPVPRPAGVPGGLKTPAAASPPVPGPTDSGVAASAPGAAHPVPPTEAASPTTNGGPPDEFELTRRHDGTGEVS